MINLLLVDVAEKGFTSIGVRKVKTTTNIDNLYMIVCERKELEYYKELGVCFVREDVVRGKYTDFQWDWQSFIPLEDEVFEYMNPYVIEIFLQQERFEQRYDYHVDSSWRSHYEIYMHNLSFWYNMLIREKITHVFMSEIPHEGYESIIYHLCKFLKIPVCMTFESLIPKRKYILDDYRLVPARTKELYNQWLEKYKNTPIDDIGLSGICKEVYQQWISLKPEKMTPIYMKGNRLKETFHMRYGETNILRVWYSELGSYYAQVRYEKRYLAKALFEATLSSIKKIPIVYKRWQYAHPYWKKTIDMRRYYDSIAEKPVAGEQYIYFALHYQPEATSNPIAGGVYVDQRIPLRILSKSLSGGLKVYVKIHPDQLAFFSGKEHFKEMAELPNVRLMKENCSTFELMRDAVAVASIAGTACWECQFWGKPAILFGYSYKNATPLAFSVRTVSECKQAIRQILCNCPKTDQKSLKIFVKLMQDITFDEDKVGLVYPEIVIKFISGNIRVMSEL